MNTQFVTPFCVIIVDQIITNKRPGVTQMDSNYSNLYLAQTTV